MRRQVVLWGMVLVLLGVTSAPAHAAWGDPPAIGSAGAANVTTTSAKLQASVTFNEFAANWWFTYSCAGCAEGVQETPHQEEIPSSEAEALSPMAIAWPIKHLRPSTTYTVTLYAGSDTWWQDPRDGGDPVYPMSTRTFTFRTADPAIPPTPVAPSPTTQPATGISANAATLNALVVPGTTGAVSDTTTVSFEWGDQGGAFDHTTAAETLPADASPYPESIPITGLTPGRSYQYRVVAVRGGRRYVGATLGFQTQVIPSCPSGTTFQTVTLGHVVVTGCLRGEDGAWVAETAVRVNGVLFEPAGATRSGGYDLSCSCGGLQSYLDAGNRLYLDRAGHAFGTTGRWRMSAGPLVGMHTGQLSQSGIDWDADDPLLSVGADRSVDLLDFPLAGQLTFTPKADGTSRLGLLVGMPVALGGVTGETAVKVNPGGDLTFDRLRIEVGEVALRGFEMGGLKFLYDRTEDLWEGAADVALPTPSKVNVGADVTVTHGHFGTFSGYVDGLNQHLAYGVYLQKVGLSFGLDPVLLGGSVGLSAGPKVAGFSALGVDGSFLLHADTTSEVRILPGGVRVYSTYPPYLQLSGTISAFSIPLRQAWIRFYMTNQAWLEAGGSVGVDIKAGDVTAFRLGGDAMGSLRGSTFEMSGEMALTVFDYDIARADAILGTRGIAACGSILDGAFEVGGYMRWGQDGHTMWECSMSKLDAALGARASAAGTGVVHLPRDDRSALIRFSGHAGRAPQIRLHAPDGRVIQTPAAGVGNTTDGKTYVAFRDEREGFTDVLVSGLGDGRWTYETVDGSTPVAGVRTARPLPKVRVRAHVVRHGRHAALRWHLRRIPGQRVTFMESGPGAPPRVLARTRRARGHVRFRPFLTPERDRTVVALVEQDGKARDRRTVAHYTAPRAPRVTRVRHLHARLRHGRVKVTWRRMPAAARFHVLVQERGGRRYLRTVRGHRLVLRGHRARVARRVAVRAVDAGGRTSHARRAGITRPHRHKHRGHRR